MLATPLQNVSTLLGQRREAGRQAKAIFARWEAGELSDEEMLVQIKASVQALVKSERT